MCELLVVEGLNGALERGALGALVGGEAGFAGPAGELAMRGELQRHDLIARQACRWLRAHRLGSSLRNANSTSPSGP
jgi:hypothetical protein